MRILKYRQTYRGDSHFALWLYRIARNAHADHFRKKHAVDFNDEQLEGQQSNDPLPIDTIEYGQQIDLLHRALAQLPHDKREVLVLSRFQELKYHEIADLLNCTVGTIKLRVHRAIKELRTAFYALTNEKLS